ncbi:MAG: PEGA domain-containing protein [Acidobacteriota bacterium]
MAPRYESRGTASRNVSPRTYSSVRGGYYGRNGGVRYSRIAPTRFYRPYYSFRPRLSLGFGLWAGYPFAYSYGYYDPFYYPYGYASPYSSYPPYAYGYPAAGYPANPPVNTYPPSSNYPSSAPQGSPYPAENPQNSIGVDSDQTNTGGLSFDISPASAELLIDGNLIGTVGQFTPTSQPLGLASGHHKVEVRASGYRTMSFDVDIVAGEVIPYQGTMER